VYRHPVLMGEMDKAKNILFELYKFFSKNMDVVRKLLDTANYISDGDEKRAVVDFLALMTDTEAVKLYYKYYIPRSFYLF
jgi:dGTP triphosphohydrolase